VVVTDEVRDGAGKSIESRMRWRCKERRSLKFIEQGNSLCLWVVTKELKERP
jgi:hypothetical protein